MSAGTMHDLVLRVSQRLAGEALRELPDDLLIARYRSGEQSAFTVLVERHAALVLSACRRMLGAGPDAEDAFQATFLILARRVHEFRWERCIRGWLYRVAIQVGRRARQRAARLRDLDRSAARAESAASHDPTWQEGLARIDEELAALPDAYRAVLLASAEGKCRDETATEMGLSDGQVKGLLERARELLRKRLLKRGVALPLAVLVVLLQQGSATAAAPLVSATVSASLAYSAGQCHLVAPSVLALTQGVLSAMKILSALWIAALTTLATLATAVGVWAAQPSYETALLEEKKPAVEAKKPDGEKPAAPVVKGTLSAVDAAKNTVTIDLPGIKKEGEVKPGEKLTLAVAADAVIQSAGKPAKLADLKVGEFVVAKLSEDKKTVLGLMAGQPEKPPVKPGEKPGEKPAEKPGIKGTLSAVDAVKNTIVIDLPGVKKEGEVKPGEKLTLAVAADAVIQSAGKPAKLADLKVGEPVVVKLSEDKKTVLGLMAGQPEKGEKPPVKPGEKPAEKVPSVRGKVKAVDADKKTVTLTVATKVEKGAAPVEVEKTLPLAKEFKVVISGKPAELKDIKVGEQAFVKMNAENAIIEISFGEAEKQPEKK